MNARRPIDLVAEHLPGAHPFPIPGQGLVYTGPCPVQHSRPELVTAMEARNGHVILDCTGKCTTPAILDAIGLDEQVLLPQAKAQPAGASQQEPGEVAQPRQADQPKQAESTHVASTAVSFPLPAKTRAPNWPAPPAPAAFSALAGEIVHCVGPHSEADPVGVLAHVLVAFGNAVGGSPHFMVGATSHPARENAILVGKSSKARKGESWNPVRTLFAVADPDWVQHRVQNGLSTGEGLISAVRDPVERSEWVKDVQPNGSDQNGDAGGHYERVVVDEGVTDKRMFVLEPEFARVLRVGGRDGNTLSPLIREAWDSGDLRTMTKNSPQKATGAHISLVGHVTAEELQCELKAVDAVNGLSNRFLWFCVQRNKLLPEPAAFTGAKVDRLAHKLATAVTWARTVGELTRESGASAQWRDIYAELSAEQPGLVGAVLARGEAHVLRLSLVYALLDQSPVITVAHQDAALAVWKYVERSVQYIFGGQSLLGRFGARTGLQGQLLEALTQSGGRAKRGDLERRLHLPAEQLDALLGTTNGRVRQVTEQTGGRPAEWLEMVMQAEAPQP